MDVCTLSIVNTYSHLPNYPELNTLILVWRLCFRYILHITQDHTAPMQQSQKPDPSPIFSEHMTPTKYRIYTVDTKR